MTNVANGKLVGTPTDLASYMLFDYWGGGTPPWVNWLGQSKIIYYCIEELDTQAEKDMASAALQLWQDVADITLVEVSAVGANWLSQSPQNKTVIVFTDHETGEADTATSHNPILVNISPSWLDKYGTGIGTYSFTTYIHESGHALGLGHPGDYNHDSDDPHKINYVDDAIYDNDTRQASVMSYFNQSNYLDDGSGDVYNVKPMTPQMADILALQLVYGAATTRDGDTIYGSARTPGRSLTSPLTLRPTCPRPGCPRR